ncbi:Bax inhibitor-1/YccA family protein [Sphingomonas psychrotolerans]|uniref:Bax inhibitor-1/YccA family protein n=1 Tax=Sphingomonas psychrotolerans TaxID=1327635 RepID=A0ABU3N354_9SPHN|nr:Bax inhibitor-1/YccA family protein [Sphingomonas psychrotolerans]MDT8758898.1 Bax inhibitor-1/YccA family protein [Sphingomonas psychrotolerans]
MANWSDPRTGAAYAAAGARAEAQDAGLRAYMLSVYNYMLSGVLLTGIVALAFGKVDALQRLLFVVQETSRGYSIGPSILGWIVMLSPLAIVFAMSFGQARMSEGTLKALFFAYAGLLGASLSTIFITYTDTSIAQVFFGTAAGFAGLSLYGYTTKRDLSGFGTFLIMGLIGLIVASIVNLFLQSSMMSLVISVIGVLIFAGLTAYDTQKIKSMYVHVAGTDMMGKVVIMGALNLYLDFINMFLFLLRLFGSARD